MYTQYVYTQRETDNRRAAMPEKKQTLSCLLIALFYYGDKKRHEHGPKHQLEAVYFEAPR